MGMQIECFIRKGLSPKYPSVKFISTLTYLYKTALFVNTRHSPPTLPTEGWNDLSHFPNMFILCVHWKVGWPSKTRSIGKQWVLRSQSHMLHVWELFQMSSSLALGAEHTLAVAAHQVHCWSTGSSLVSSRKNQLWVIKRYHSVLWATAACRGVT